MKKFTINPKGRLHQERSSYQKTEMTLMENYLIILLYREIYAIYLLYLTIFLNGELGGNTDLL